MSEIAQLKAEIAILRATVLAQAPPGSLNEAQILVDCAREAAAILGRPQLPRKVTAGEWEKLPADERLGAYVDE